VVTRFCSTIEEPKAAVRVRDCSVMDDVEFSKEEDTVETALWDRSRREVDSSRATETLCMERACRWTRDAEFSSNSAVDNAW